MRTPWHDIYSRRLWRDEISCKMDGITVGLKACFVQNA
jgi:hypothetical protein